MKKSSKVIVLLLSIYTSASWADSMLGPARPTTVVPAGGIPDLISVSEPKAKRFFAVGLFTSTIGVGWRCTATLIASSKTPDPAQPALMLTAGHCANPSGLTGDNEVVIDRPMPPGWQFIPAFFHDNKDDHIPVPVKRIVYSSMKSTEIAVLELDATYGELSSRQIEPLVLTSFNTSTQKIDIAHIPLGPFPGGSFLRYSACNVMSARPVFEGYYPIREDLPWFWPKALPSDCIGVYGGSSGSPVFDKDGKRVVGVLSTAVAPSLNGCGFARPCEITGDGMKSRPDAVYFNSVDQILLALKADNTLDLSKLDQGDGVGLTRVGSWSTRSEVADASGKLQPARWNLKIDPAFQRIRYKTGPAGSIQCDQPKGYGESLPVADQPFLQLPVDSKEGIQAICVIGQKTGQTAWQLERHATIKLRQIDNTAPVDRPVIVLAEDNSEFWVVLSLLNLNEIVSVYVKYGPLDSTDCANADGYVLQVSEEPIDLPKPANWRFCTYGTDEAGNESPPVSRDFEASRKG
ncbi:serine protease [Pseudomonas sp. WJP1]|uniref:trypsin-like serine peptidase n=1 Tax=Pseudomonas sp. WJP1 TaxID=2986947 RepID=UPI00234B90DC|nr:trypsin-like peptidase domain-containing protein [Pseudomonas sp. WJP1]WCM48881.1 serine protease [Pseudomonas sp. WJP1]